MMVSAQVALYPMDTDTSDRVINESLTALTESGLDYQVDTMSTRIYGPPEAVWDGLRNMFEQAQIHGKEVAMVVTIANSR